MTNNEEFKTALLRVIFELGDNAYGLTIRHALENRLGRPVSLGSIYTALDELMANHDVSFIHGDPTPERGARTKRFVNLEASGLSKVRHEKD